MSDDTVGQTSSVSLPGGDRRDQHSGTPEVPPRIYMLGTGGVGKLVAHSIRGIPDPPPVTILFHRPEYLQDFEGEENSISLTTGKNTETRGGFDAEMVYPGREIDKTQPSNGEEPISNLIISVKAHQTISAVTSVAHRLTPDSTILFLQNGMGVIDEVIEKLYPDLETRPNFMQGINSHGIFVTGTCAATHAGQGAMMLGLLPQGPMKSDDLESESSSGESLLGAAPGARYLLRTLTRTPVLGAVGLSPTDLLQAQLEKLVANCLINPLTVMFDCRNGGLLHNFAVSRVMYLLLAEISLVIRSLPELRGIPNVATRFSPERLESSAQGVTEKTAENISSMLQDVRRGIKTEIEYINGYVVKRGEELGIKPAMNYMLMQMVIGKQQMVSKEMDNYTPMKI